MSWLDRATPVDNNNQPQPTTDPNSHWLTRATPVDANGQPISQDPSQYQPTLLDRAADTIQGAEDKVMGPVVRGVMSAAKAGSRLALGTEAPADALGKAVSYLPQKIDQAGQYIAEKGAQTFPSLPAAIPAAAGMAAQTIPYLLLPGGDVEGSLLKPIVPAERAAAVDAARAAAVPLSRAEMTGSPAAAALENWTEKTPLGGIPIQNARAAGDSAMQAYKENVLSKFGNARGNYDAGAAAQQGQATRDAVMNATRQKMFDAIPENVNIPLNESRNMADTIMQEQSQYLPTTRNGDVLAIAKDVQNAHAGVAPGGTPATVEAHGVTTQRPDQIIPPSTRSLQSSLVGDNGKPLSYTQDVPGKTIPGRPEYGVKFSASPGGQQPDLPVVQPGAKTGDPHALFSYNDNFGPEGSPRSLYTVYGDPNHPAVKQLGYGSTLTKGAMDNAGIPITGREPRTVGKWDPLDLAHQQTSDQAPGQTLPNFQLVKRLRETLAGKASDARSSGNFAAERDYLRLKGSLDNDVQNYVQGQKTPLGSMMGQEFADRYQQANAFSGAYKQLFKGDLANKIAGAPPEKILDSVFQKNNQTAINQFRAIVGDDAFQQAKSKWVNDLLNSPNVSQSLSEKKIDPGTLNAILSPSEQKAVQDYGLVQGLRKTVGNVQGTSGSARIAAHTLSYGVGLEAMNQAVHGHLLAAGAYGAGLAAPYPLAQMLTSKAATEGLNLSIPASVRNAAYSDLISRVTTRDNQR